MATQFDHLWSDGSNWAGGVYRCEADPRVVVPGRGFGTVYTLNFAHARASWGLLLGCFAIFTGATLLPIAFQARSSVLVVSVVLALGLVLGAHYWLAHQHDS